MPNLWWHRVWLIWTDAGASFLPRLRTEAMQWLISHAPPEVKRKKKIRRIIYAVAGSARHRAHHGRRLAAQAGGAERRSRDRLGRHRQARPDDPSGPRLGHARPGGHPLDSGDDAGPRRAHRAPPRRAGHADDRHPRAEQPRPAAAGHGCAARLGIRGSRLRQQEGRAPERSCSTRRPASATSRRNTSRRT